MSRRKRPVVVELEDGEFDFGPATYNNDRDERPLKHPKLSEHVENTPIKSPGNTNIFQKLQEKLKSQTQVTVDYDDELTPPIDVDTKEGSQPSITKPAADAVAATNLSTSMQPKNIATTLGNSNDEYNNSSNGKSKAAQENSNVIDLLDDTQDHHNYMDDIDDQDYDDVMYIDDEEQFQMHLSSSSNLHSRAADFVEIITPANEVLTVFPDADPKDVDRLLVLYADHVESVVQHMLEKGYEKIDLKELQQAKLKLKEEMAEKDFTSSSWETTTSYRSDAINELINNFPFIRNESIHKIFRTQKFHYYHAVKYLEETTGMPPRLYFRQEISKQNSTTMLFDHATMQAIRVNLAKHQATGQIQTRNSTKSIPIPREDIDPTLTKELQFIRKQRLQEVEKKDKTFAEELNYQFASDENALMECGCCYSEYPFEQLVQCTEAHLFCKQCLQHYAEQTLFGDGRTILKCMNTSGDPCPGVFTESMLRASLPEKVLAKYSEAQTRDVLKAAQIDDLVTCFDCQYQASLAADAGKIMHCPQCNKDTCRECGDEAHIPLKCHEVEKKGETAKRLTVEEALTQARVRSCPKCKTRFYKTEGCNKMTCTCGINICYICRKDITKEKYQHFCQTPHCTHKDCSRCRLYTNSVEDDVQAMREAGIKALQEVTATADGADPQPAAAATNSNTNNPKNTVAAPQIDLNKYLETLPAAPLRPGQMIGGVMFPAPVVAAAARFAAPIIPAAMPAMPVPRPQNQRRRR